MNVRRQAAAGIGQTLDACAMLLCAALCGCGLAPSAPPGAPPPAAQAPPEPARSPASLEFEHRQRERALAFAHQGALADAALAWETLLVLRPDAPEYLERLAETRRQIDQAVAERLPRAAQAYKRGDLDDATQEYLAVLALQPQLTQAADALRAIERDRVKRNNLGKLSRITLNRRAVSDSEQAELPPAGAAGAPDRNEIEHAAMLADQGEFDDAIALLQRRAAAEPRDLRSRDLLAEIYCRKGDALLPRDQAGARAAYLRCLKWRPGHPVATARLREIGKHAP